MQKIFKQLNISPSAIKNRRGFSLLECVVALAVFAVMALLVATILQMTVLQYKRNYENAERLDEDEQAIVAGEAAPVTGTDSSSKIEIPFDASDDDMTIDNENPSLNAGAAQADTLKTIFGLYSKITVDEALPSNAKLETTIGESFSSSGADGVTTYTVTLNMTFGCTNFALGSTPIKIALPLGTDSVEVAEYGGTLTLVTSNSPQPTFSLSKNEVTYAGTNPKVTIEFTISEADYKKHYVDLNTYFGGSTVTYTPAA